MVILGMGVLGGGAALLASTKKAQAAPAPRPGREGAEVELPGQPPEQMPQEYIDGLMDTYQSMISNPMAWSIDEMQQISGELYALGFRDEALHLESKIRARLNPPVPKEVGEDGIPVFDPEDFPTEEELESDIINRGREAIS